MVCIYCSGATQVTNSRPTSEGQVVWRRRRCRDCHAEWTTHEVTDESTAYRVKSRQGGLSPFKRQKLFISIYEACRHRKHALEDSEALTDTVVTKLRSNQNAVWDKSRIRNQALETLTSFDITAAGVYRSLHN